MEKKLSGRSMPPTQRHLVCHGGSIEPNGGCIDPGSEQTYFNGKDYAELLHEEKCLSH